MSDDRCTFRAFGAAQCDLPAEHEGSHLVSFETLAEAAEKARQDTADAIVRDLARLIPPLDSVNFCRLCGGEVDHKAECPWRRSVEWVAAHPANGDET